MHEFNFRSDIVTRHNWHLLDRLTHIQAHFHTVLSMVRQRLWQAGHTVVTVPKDFDPHTFVFLHDKTQAQHRVKKKTVPLTERTSSFRTK